MVVLSGGIRKGLLKVGDPCRILEEGPFARQSRGHRSFKAKDSAGAKAQDSLVCVRQCLAFMECSLCAWHYSRSVAVLKVALGFCTPEP